MNRHKYKKRAYELRRCRRLYRRRIHFEKSRKVEPKKSVSDKVKVIVTTKHKRRLPVPIKAPSDFRLLQNTDVCVSFFKRIRSAGDAYVINGKKRIKINLQDVAQIDFASTVLLNAIGEELKGQRIPCYLSGNMPNNSDCAKYLIDSGFLNEKYDPFGHKISNTGQSSFMKIERGEEKLSAEHIRNIIAIEKHIHQHLFGLPGSNLNHIILLKEICGNSVEWSNAFKSQWTLGAKFEDDKVVLVALDLGKGILESLRIRFFQYIEDLVKNNSDKEILEGAFNQKYGSASNDRNRNNGLPSLKYANEVGLVKELQVLTNNVYLNFSHETLSKKYHWRRDCLKGTIYSWVIDKDCFIEI